MNAPITLRDVLQRYVWPAVASIAFCLSASNASETEGYKHGFSQSILMGHSFFLPGCNDIEVLAPYYGYSRHTQYKQLGGGTNGDPGSMWRDTGEDEGAKAEIKKGATEILGMTAFSAVDGDSDYEDYKQWIDFTLQYNPDTFDTFFIMIPWVSYANNPTYELHRARQDLANEYVHDIIQQLRVEYPQLTCLAMPVGEAMTRLWLLYDQGQLGSEIWGVKQTGNRDNYLQFDNTGHAGKIMEDTLGLIWQKTLYPETDIRTVADPPTFQQDWTYDIRQLAYELWQDDPYAHRYNDTPDDFESYISDPAFALDPSEQGVGDDPDGDGRSNLYEYALDGDPADPFNKGARPTWSYVGDTLEFRHLARWDDPALVYTVESTTDLASGIWTTVVPSQQEISVTGGDYDEVINRISVDTPPLFIRLKVTNEPINLFTISEKPSVYQEANRLGIWFSASDFDPLGFCLEPGQSVEVDVTTISGSTLPKLLVGTYSRYTWNETPTVYPLTEGKNTITDPEGGLLYLQYVTEGVPSGEAEVTIHGASPIPSYVLGETTHAEWLRKLETMTYQDVQFISNRCMLVVTKETALRFKDQNQDAMLTVLDQISDTADYISGIDGSSYLHKKNAHKMLLTELTEQDLSFSLAAGEHRIMVPTEVIDKVMDPAIASSTAWGLWHEMGHHRQALNWDWIEVDEVTVNIYALACLYDFEGDMVWLKGHPVWDTLGDYFNSLIEERNYNTDTTLTGKGRLAMFRQLWMAYGDEFYIQVHKLAREDNAKPNPRVPPRSLDTEAQMANFMILASEASGYNLKSFFQEWGFVLPQERFDALDALNLPDPEIDLISLRE